MFKIDKVKDIHFDLIFYNIIVLFIYIYKEKNQKHIWGALPFCFFLILLIFSKIII